MPQILPSTKLPLVSFLFFYFLLNKIANSSIYLSTNIISESKEKVEFSLRGLLSQEFNTQNEG